MAHNIGLVRLMVYVLVPLLIALFCVLIFSGIMQTYTKEQLDEARAEDEVKTKQLAVLRFKRAASRLRRSRNSKYPSGLDDGTAQLQLTGASSAAYMAAQRKGGSRDSPRSYGLHHRHAAFCYGLYHHPPHLRCTHL